MIPEAAGPRFYHQEEEPPLPNLSHPPVVPGGSLCLLQATEADPQSFRGAECLPRGPTWAPSLRACPLQYPTRRDPSNQVCTTGGPRQCLRPPGSLAWGRLLPLSPETEVLLSEEAPSVRPPPPLTGLPCPLLLAGPWMTSPLRRRRQWATGPPSTGKLSPLRPLRTASPRCLPRHGLPPCRRPLRHRRHPAGLALPTCLQAPAAVTKSQGSHSGTCPSLRLHLPCLHLDVRALSLPRPVRDPLLQCGTHRADQALSHRLLQ